MATPPPDDGDQQSTAPNVHEDGHEDGHDSDATQPLQDDGDTPTKDTRNSSPKKQDGAGSDDEPTPQYTATTTTTRRNANGSVSSVYSGNKIRHLKKPDGIPLWRKDIQYDFLRIVFTDDKKVFHKASDGSSGNTFADIYLDAMAKSSKCSKILKEKLLTDRPAAVNMAMVCLLVNVGRMNTTLNFFPEMRAQLRTYHAIPSLQHQDVSSYKQLQDAPRLKSILKGATEDVEQPGTIEDIMAAKIPRTNPVNLIFVLALAAPKISGIHFDVPRDFFDLVMKETLSSKSRAIAFLWLMWWYLESDFTVDDALKNPYGPGRYAKDSESELPLRCPPFEILTEEEAAKENVDTLEEQEFGEQKRLEREAINNGQMPAVYSGPKRSKKSTANEPGLGAPLPGQQRVWRNKPPSKAAPRQSLDAHSDSDRTLSPPPKGGVKISNLLNEDSANSTPAKGSGKGNWRRHKDIDGSGNPRSTPKDGDGLSGSMFMPFNAETPTGIGNKRQRAQTSHQRTVESKRKAQVYDILYEGLEKVRCVADRKRVRSSMTSRALARIKDLSPQYDSEDEAQKMGQGRITAARMGVTMGGFAQIDREASEYGAEAWTMARTLNRLRRRLYRKWDTQETGPLSKRQRRNEDAMNIDGEDNEQENGAYDADESRMQIRAGADDEWSDGDE